MRQVVFSVIFCGVFLLGKGQEIVSKQLEINRKTFRYAYFSETDFPLKTLFAFHNNDTALWNASKFCQELAPIAEKNGYELIVPEISEDFDVISFLDTWNNRLSKRDSIIFLVNGTSARYAEQLLQLGISGLVIMPADSSFRIQTDRVVPVSIITDTDQYPAQQLWIDSLTRSDLWLNAQNVSSPHYYYIDNYYEVFDKEILWLDSATTFFSDSASRTLWLSNGGIQNDPDEVYRQGNKVELTLKMTNPEEVLVQVRDLSANVMLQTKNVYGIGLHEIAIETKDLEWGVYNIEIKGDRLIKRFKIMIRG
jgi:hypothetical protein